MITRPTRAKEDEQRNRIYPVDGGAVKPTDPQTGAPRITEKQMVAPMSKRGIKFGNDPLKGFWGKHHEKLREMKRIEMHLENPQFFRKLKIIVDQNGGFYRKNDYKKALQGISDQKATITGGGAKITQPGQPAPKPETGKTQPEKQPQPAPKPEAGKTQPPVAVPDQPEVSAKDAKNTVLGMKKTHAYIAGGSVIALIIVFIIMKMA